MIWAFLVRMSLTKQIIGNQKFSLFPDLSIGNCFDANPIISLNFVFLFKRGYERYTPFSKSLTCLFTQNQFLFWMLHFFFAFYKFPNLHKLYFHKKMGGRGEDSSSLFFNRISKDVDNILSFVSLFWRYSKKKKKNQVCKFTVELSLHWNY